MPLQVKLDQAQQVRRRIKAGMRARRQEISQILRPGLLKVADAVDKAALDLLEAEVATAEHFGLSFTPSAIVRAVATAGRQVRNVANFDANGRDLAEMTFGIVAK